MKKRSKFYSLMFLFASCLFVSCEKDDEIVPSEVVISNSTKTDNKNSSLNSQLTTNFAFVDNYLSFRSIQMYEDFINENTNEKEEVVKNYLNSHNFINYFQNPEAYEIMDNFFGLLLNPDGVIEIGEFIYKVDAANNTVFAILKNEKSMYYDNLLSGSADNVHVFAYSTEDDVFDLVQGSFSESCGGAPFFNRKTNMITSVNGSPLIGGVEFQTKYLKLGIYFSVRVKVFQYAGPGNIYPNDYDFKFEINTPDMRMRRRPCNSGSEIAHASGLRSFSSSGAWSMDGFRRVRTWKGYEGVRGLNRYRVWIRGYINNNLAHTDWLGRQHNY